MLRLISRQTENNHFAKLIARSKQQYPQILHIDVYAEYYLSTPTLSAQDQKKLLTILNADLSAQVYLESYDHLFWVLPRLGTYSSWGSKALDILQLSGLKKVQRIEKGFVYCLKVVSAEKDTSWIEPLKAQLHDKMVETVISNVSDLEHVFIAPDEKEYLTIDLLQGGIEKLQVANQELGLALSDPEIDFLYQSYSDMERNPTDAELMMFSQINSEHCRHKVFNAHWSIDDDSKALSLFQMIKNTHKISPEGVLSAYKDNASVIESLATTTFMRNENQLYEFQTQKTDILMKVETHNHPTAIEPFAGSGTGQGGEIRDEGATGRGSEPKVGLTGFTVSNLCVPGFKMPWEQSVGYPGRIQSALDIMLKAPIGGAAFNNEFGRPNICGYFRTFEQPIEETPSKFTSWGFHKPVMIAGGMGSIYPSNIKKLQLNPGDYIIVLGGPAMKIGIGGGSASSMAQGQSHEQLDFASVQRQNPEMERRAQEVISSCSLLSENIIKSIHDVGAGGVANAISEIVHDSDLGVDLQLEQIPVAEHGMSPLEIMCNESQERYIIAIDPNSLDKFDSVARRERCPYQVVGKVTKKQHITVHSDSERKTPVDLPSQILFADPPQMKKNLTRIALEQRAVDTNCIDLSEALQRCLLAPAVADKGFLITIGDRSVTGLVARDQMVGPWQVPVADCGVSASCYDTLTGEAMAMGEKPLLSLINAKAMARMAVTEAILNILSSDIQLLSNIKLSCNWMADSKSDQEAVNLFDAVEAIGMTFCPELGIAVPVGKDSMSMQTTWRENDQNIQVTSPVTLVVSAFSPVKDITKTVTPLLKTDEKTALLLIDLAGHQQRMGGSIFAQVTNQIGDETPDISSKVLRTFVDLIIDLKAKGYVLAYHDKSDGGVWACLCEMAFASHVGLDIDISKYQIGQDSIKALLNEEAGVVIQIRDSDFDTIKAAFHSKGLDSAIYSIARINTTDTLNIYNKMQCVFSKTRTELQALWSSLSFNMQSIRDNPQCALQAFDHIRENSDPGMAAVITPECHITLPRSLNLSKPKVAILREQGVNGHREMAAAFVQAGFEAVDVMMEDLIQGAISLSDFQMLAACGGFSYGDVLGAGKGWANAILHADRLTDMFTEFFNRDNTLTLGVCNGCQMLSLVKKLIPGAEHWPTFVQNESQQFEARQSVVEIQNSPSILLNKLQGFRLPIAVAHGEGKVSFTDDWQYQQCVSAKLVSMRYIDHKGEITTGYPHNPNGSLNGLTGLTSEDGRVTIMMPHPERVIHKWQLSWYPESWDQEKVTHTPWLHMFYSAKDWLDKLC